MRYQVSLYVTCTPSLVSWMQLQQVVSTCSMPLYNACLQYVISWVSFYDVVSAFVVSKTHCRTCVSTYWAWEVLFADVYGIHVVPGVSEYGMYLSYVMSGVSSYNVWLAYAMSEVSCYTVSQICDLRDAWSLCVLTSLITNMARSVFEILFIKRERFHIVICVVSPF